MTTAQAWMIWPENPALSFVILAVLGMAFLYAARRPVHQLLYAVGALISGPLRMAGRWLAAPWKAGRRSSGRRIPKRNSPRRWSSASRQPSDYRVTDAGRKKRFTQNR